jgi:hypothetical protein
MAQTTMALSNRNVGMIEDWNDVLKKCSPCNIRPLAVALFQNSIIPLIGIAQKEQLSPTVHLCCAQREAE